MNFGYFWVFWRIFFGCYCYTTTPSGRPCPVLTKKLHDPRERISDQTLALPVVIIFQFIVKVYNFT